MSRGRVVLGERTAHAKAQKQDLASVLEEQPGSPCGWNRMSKEERERK